MKCEFWLQIFLNSNALCVNVFTSFSFTDIPVLNIRNFRLNSFLYSRLFGHLKIYHLLVQNLIWFYCFTFNLQKEICEIMIALCGLSNKSSRNASRTRITSKDKLKVTIFVERTIEYIFYWTARDDLLFSSSK